MTVFALTFGVIYATVLMDNRIHRVTGSGETAFAAPKGNAETLRQKDRVMTILCRVGLPTPKVQPGSSRESLR